MTRDPTKKRIIAAVSDDDDLNVDDLIPGEGQFATTLAAGIAEFFQYHPKGPLLEGHGIKQFLKAIYPGKRHGLYALPTRRPEAFLRGQSHAPFLQGSVVPAAVRLMAFHR